MILILYYKEKLIPTLKKTIRNYMYQVTGVLVIVILILILYIQLLTEQNQARETGARTIAQIKSILEENQQALENKSLKLVQNIMQSMPNGKLM